MFHLGYILAELRRRRGRTILTALGLAVGVALVVTVTAVSSGLEDAQQEVLEPLTGVGTDMTLTRPLSIDGEGGLASLGEEERGRLREQAGPGPGLALRDREPGEEIDEEQFRATSQLTFSSDRVADVAATDGVAAAAGSLTLDAIHVTGTVPDIDVTQAGPGGGRPRGGFGGGSIEFASRSVTGVDSSQPEIAAVTPGQVVEGEWFSASGAPREAIVSSAYAGTENVAVSDAVTLGGEEFEVIGIASPPLGGTASDVYVKLGTLQRIAGFEGQVTAAQARAVSADAVPAVADAIGSRMDGAQVTTAADLADRVGGSLQDARELSSALGLVLAIVGLVAAVLIASLLTLSSVSKRTRELGTLKAIGWSRGAVVRQVSGESVIQGLLGGLIGAAVGLITSLAISASGWTLEASVANTAAETAAERPGPGARGGPFGLGEAITAGSEVVEISTTPSIAVILLAVGLAVAGGLVAGAAGSLRAARLPPAAALRTVE